MPIVSPDIPGKYGIVSPVSMVEVFIYNEMGSKEKQ